MLRCLLLLALMALPAAAAPPPGEWALALPRRLHAGESVVLVVTVGVLRRGQEILAITTSGQTIGTISPFGIRSGQEAGSYVLPVPAGAMRHRRLSLRLWITGGGWPPRAPTAQEVKSVELRITPAPPT